MTCDWIDRREQLTLARYATFSRDSRGRAYPEPPHPYRSVFQRDRDRILHSGAFRRLSGKMQVFTGNMGDYHRTRLTHTMEVASISRTIGRALRLNEDLIEALALLHDIGHPPFGHAGEDTLDECLRQEGGFSHNAYALTLVAEIERPYGNFPGLNLSAEVLESQQSRIDKSRPCPPSPRLEAQVVDVADSITYDAHDCDDAIKLKILRLDDLREVTLGERCLRRVDQELGTPPADVRRRAVVHALIDVQVSDFIQQMAPALDRSGWRDAQQPRQEGFRLQPGASLAGEKRELEGFLYTRVYRHPLLTEVRTAAQQKLRWFVDYLTDHPDRMPGFFRQRACQVGSRRGAVDYIAGMTDRFFEQQYMAACHATGAPASSPPSTSLDPCRT